MKCIVCNGDTEVSDSRLKKPNWVYRRRKCMNEKCCHKFTTVERQASHDAGVLAETRLYQIKKKLAELMRL